MFGLFKRPATVRVLHGSPDAPPVDIFLNDMKVVSGLPFKNISEYLQIKPGEYKLEIYPSTVPKLNPVFRKKVLLPSDSVYTIAAINKLNNLNIFIINDPTEKPRNNISYLRAVHLSPNAPAVNIRVNNRTICRNLQYKGISRYAQLDPGTYNISVLTTSGGDNVLTIPNQVLQVGFYQTVYILGLVGGEPPLQAIIPIDSLCRFRNRN